jgi:hypothetical protein
VDAFGVGATIGFELRLDPIDGGAVSVGTFPAVAEFGQRLDGRLVALQVEPSDKRFDWIVRSVALSPCETREENPCHQQQSHFQYLLPKGTLLPYLSKQPS